MSKKYLTNMKPQIILIAAGSFQDRIIGTKDNELPWPRLKPDMEHFKSVTMGHPVIMGRVTFETLRKKDGVVQPLPGRQNIVITRDPNYIAMPEVWIASSLEDAIHKAKIFNPKSMFIIGGEQIYNIAIEIADTILYTEVMLEVEGTTHFPKIPDYFSMVINGKQFASVKFQDEVELRSVEFHIQKWVRNDQ